MFNSLSLSACNTSQDPFTPYNEHGLNILHVLSQPRFVESLDIRVMVSKTMFEF